MFRSKSVFVIGAGASAEVQMPVGDKLAARIAGLVAVRWDRARGPALVSGNLHISNTIDRWAKINGQSSATYESAGQSIADAMGFSRSIDEFVNAHQDKDHITLVAKLGIAKAILKAERKSWLYLDPMADFTLQDNCTKLTWYNRLFKALTANVLQANIEETLRDVTFIVFNYDRCLEIYLINALSKYYLISQTEAYSIVDKANIIHPYGIVGKLPDPAQPALGIPFGGAIENDDNLVAIVSELQTFNETLKDDLIKGRIQDAMQTAQTLIFLGFAFHEPNMQLLDAPTDNKIRRIFATTKGFSSSDVEIIKLAVDDIIHKQLGTNNLRPASWKSVDNTCNELFRTYSMSITAKSP